MKNENREKQPPLLLTMYEQDEQNDEQIFYSLLENRYHTTIIPILREKYVLASTHGWLVLASYNGGTVYLWHPLSNETIELPRLSKPHLYNRCVLSKPPTESDCYVLFNSICEKEQYFCKIGDHEFAHQFLASGKHLLAIASFQGKTYGLVYPGFKFVTINLVGNTLEMRPMLMIKGKKKTHWKVPYLTPNWVTWGDSYLIESACGGKLLLVNKDKFEIYHDGVHLRVFRVDVNGMECVELDDIGDQTIFIGDNGSGFCCSSHGTMKPNSIYYTNKEGRHIYVYDVGDRSTTSLLPCPPDASRDLSINYWVEHQEALSQLIAHFKI